MQAEYLNSVDALALLFYSKHQILVKTASVTTVGLNIHKRKRKILTYNKESTDIITPDGVALIEVKTF